MAFFRSLPRAIWVLGFVSMLMDVSSEMIHGLLPVYLAAVLGASAAVIGLIEGMAEATVSITKIFSGVLSDYWGKRKPLTLLGYAMAALTKPIFPLAASVALVASARFIDRVGKGIRGAPRDALIADITPAGMRGASFGLRQSLDTMGAVIGPLLAVGLMALSGDNYKMVFWFAVLPAFLCVGLLAFGVKEPDDNGMSKKERMDWRQWRGMPPAFWAVAGFAAFMTLARFSEAFLILRARSEGFAATYAPFALIIMNVTYALSAYPAGQLSDRIGRRGLLAGGLALLIASDLVLAYASSIPAVVLGIGLWGVQMGFTQGILASLVADTAPGNRRGTGFGIFNLVTGAALFIASALAGWLWTRFGAPAPFLAGAACAFSALIALIFSRIIP